jgi:uncharacterized protein (TIGR00251 family)
MRRRPYACPKRGAVHVVKLTVTEEGVRLPVLVEPGAGRDRVYGEHDGRLKLSVTAAPERGKANKAVCKFLAAELGVSKSQVRILSGHHSKLKEVLLERVPVDALEAIIG